jgi:hypothetical protein
MNYTLLHITPYSAFIFDRRFGGRFPFHFQGRKISYSGNQYEATYALCLLDASFLLVFFTFKFEDIYSSETSANFELNRDGLYRICYYNLLEL